jgi:hypothetical protein
VELARKQDAIFTATARNVSNNEKYLLQHISKE